MDAGSVWQTAGGPVVLGRSLIVGILNTTPDSFWAGSRASSADAAAALAERMLAEGADLLDIGGESTRPGAMPVDAAAEIARVVPVVDRLARAWPAVPLSVDTTKAEVAAAALDAGAWIINDVSGLRLDPRLAGVVATARAGVVLMHSRGGISEMATYEAASYGADPVGEVMAELGRSVLEATAAGVDEAAIVVDPGLGFAKRTAHSIACLAGLDRLGALGRPVLVGPSRKRFVGELAARNGTVLPPGLRLEGTIAACVAARLRGASLFRVHDVQEVRRALAVADAIVAAA
jgi:dihydropteroate synthase